MLVVQVGHNVGEGYESILFYVQVFFGFPAGGGIVSITARPVFGNASDTCLWISLCSPCMQNDGHVDVRPTPYKAHDA